jgi:hypothetical protein
LDGGAGGWVVDVDVLVADFAELGKMRELKEEAVELDNVVESATGGFDGGVEISKDLLGLCAEVVFADEIAGLVEGDLAGDKDELAVCYGG